MSDLLTSVTTTSEGFRQLAGRMDAVDSHLAGSRSVVEQQAAAVQKAFDGTMPVAAALQESFKNSSQAASDVVQQVSATLAGVSQDVEQAQKTFETQQQQASSQMVATAQAIQAGVASLQTLEQSAIARLNQIRQQAQEALGALTAALTEVEQHLSQQFTPQVVAFAGGVDQLASTMKSKIEGELIPLHLSHRQEFADRMAGLEEQINGFVAQNAQSRRQAADETSAQLLQNSQTDWNGGDSTDIGGAANQRASQTAQALAAGRDQVQQARVSLLTEQDQFKATIDATDKCFLAVLAIPNELAGIIQQGHAQADV